MKKIFSKENLIEWLYINLGIILMAFAYSFFLEPMNIVTGGVSGLGIILNICGKMIQLMLFYGLNILLLLIGFVFLGKDFFH